ncbi:MAG: hypothetical protein A2096_13830 [Spirochaetes bacterium GWF1_41_5]|nr:MAG: hypothetical protein A2096_13830 [Spirochaetes bacterium GWF1_41_5]
MQPNILIFMTDHQRADTVLPEHPAIMPNINSFINDSVLFSNTFCPSPHCCPARATFMSGLYPSGHGVWNNVSNTQALSAGLNPGVRLWSEDLKAGGYDLYYAGKWHVSSVETPADRGWTELFPATPPRGMRSNEAEWENFRETAVCEKNVSRGEGQIVRPGYGIYTLYGTSGHKQKHDENALAASVKQLENLSGSKNPWCMFTGAIAPHDPYMVPKEYLDLYDINKIPLPKSYEDDLSDKPGIYRRMRRSRFDQLSEREVREGIRHFWAYCSYLDDVFGRLLAALDKTGQKENTLVLYCADHGDYCGEHGLFAKGIPCFKGAYHVPAVIRWPQGIKNPGRRVDELVSLADFAPTFLEACGIKQTYRTTGMSLMPFLLGNTPKWRDFITTQCNGVELYFSQRSVMTGQYKYVFNGFDEDEFYDLRKDPDEMKNEINNGHYEEIKRALCKKLWSFSRAENDNMINKYITVGLAPYGPGEIFSDN